MVPYIYLPREEVQGGELVRRISPNTIAWQLGLTRHEAGRPHLPETHASGWSTRRGASNEHRDCRQRGLVTEGHWTRTCIFLGLFIHMLNKWCKNVVCPILHHRLAMNALSLTRIGTRRRVYAWFPLLLQLTSTRRASATST